MLIFDSRKIGNKLLAVRKRMGLTQAEVAEKANVADRTYADIERGTVNMRIDTILKICEVLYITPDEILTEDSTANTARAEDLWSKLKACSPKDQETALSLLAVYLNSLST